MQKNKNQLPALLLGLTGVLVLSSCALPGIGKPPPRPSKYGVQNEAPRFGDWLVNPNRCTVESATQDYAITTDGTLTRTSLLPLKVQFNKALTGKPRSTLTGIPVPVPQEGTGRTYTIYLEYSARSVADLLYDGTFLTLTYQPLNVPHPLESYLQTRGLIEAVTSLKTLCN